MVDETAVASFYDRTTAIFCELVALTLALRIPGLCSGGLSQPMCLAIQSLMVSLNFPFPTTLAKMDAQLEEAMDKETLKLFRLLAERNSPGHNINSRIWRLVVPKFCLRFLNSQICRDVVDLVAIFWSVLL